ncbi:hypothetical protein ACJJI5_11610 [Microbulbifer sp. EKSA008]|uniref:hypothetical protein n=1 Tax=unclassified Microbulbifer TaxID=2619833 RepID=UPI004042E6CA
MRLKESEVLIYMPARLQMLYSVNFYTKASFVFFGVILCCGAICDEGKLTLKPYQQLSTEGFFDFQWQGVSQNTTYILQLSLDKEFSDIERTYSLPKEGEVALSGFESGYYYFRLAGQEGRYFSNVVSVDVVHRNIVVALILFATGAFLFLILIVSIYCSGWIR